MIEPTGLLHETRNWDNNQRQQFLDNLRIQAAQTRYPTPADMAQHLLPDYTITPAISLISNAVADAVLNRDRRYLITTPPRTGKSELVSVVGPVYAQVHRPGAEVVLASYADLLATDHSRKARQLIAEHQDRLGVRLGGDKKAVGHWVTTHGTGRGGLLAGGILSGLTGFGANLLIVDDVFKNHQEADSITLRRRIVNEFRSTLMTRLYPGASVIVTMTRWHPEDLAGQLLDEGGWTHINIPAQAQPGVPDALGREPGEWLQSALGFTPKDFEHRRRAIGERAWHALYQGVPTPPSGGLFTRSWFDNHRCQITPDRTVARVVAVDPAETGDRDEAGIIAAALQPDGTTVLTHDRSGHMTSDQWAKAAVELAVETGAVEIAVETYTAGTTYTNVIKRAIDAHKRELQHLPDGHNPDTVAAIRRCTDLRVFPWRGKGDAVARSALLRQAVEVGTCQVLRDELAELEEQAVLWQTGQHQPDRLAAAVIAHDRLVNMGGQRTTIGNPMRSATRTQPNSSRTAWLGRKVG